MSSKQRESEEEKTKVKVIIGEERELRQNKHGEHEKVETILQLREGKW